MAGYKPTIYLRDLFHIKWDAKGAYLNTFLEGKKRFLQSTKRSEWSLVAAFADWPVFNQKLFVERQFDVIQIWRLDTWDRLYNTMADFSETSWYRHLGHALADEHQDLLINAGVREPSLDLKWDSDDRPGYAYVYEVSRPQEGYNQAYLREVNWFDAQMSAAHGWKLVCWASQVTAQPAELSILWRVPTGVGSNIVQSLVDIAQSRRYNDRMLSFVQTSRRRIYYPIYTERLAELAAGQNP